MSRGRPSFFTAIAAALGVFSHVAASVVFVDADRPPGGDGASWATAFDDLQDALDLAIADPAVEQVWVAEGTYRPDRGTGNRTDAFKLISFLAVYGGFAGDETRLGERDPTRHVTVLSGDLVGDDQPGFVNYGDNSFHVIDARNASTGSVLDGFTITGGNADVGCCIFDRGGGMVAEFGATTLNDCIFRANRAKFGGAIYCERQSPSITDCLFEGNAALEDGGAVYCRIGAPVFDTCEFRGNTAVRGAGLVADDGGPELLGCTFVDNTAEIGGAVFNLDGAETMAFDCLFLTNDAVNLDEGFASGGAVSSVDSAPRFDGCTFSGNVAFSNGSGSLIGEGGALHNDAGAVTITDCLFEFNVGEIGGAHRLEDGTSATIDGCTFIGNLSLSHGGGISAITDAQVDVTGCVFTANFAQGSGGGVANSAVCAMSDCLLEGNGARTGGGFATGGSGVAFTITRTTLRDNEADRGGAFFLGGGGPGGTMSESVVEDNRSTADGGGLWMENAFVAILDTTIARNVSDEGSGGGIWADDPSLSVDRCTVIGNAAALGGGAMYYERGPLAVESSVFVGNTAGQGGAFYFIVGGDKVVDGCTIASNAADDEGGGVFVENGSASIANSILWGNTSTSGDAQDEQIAFGTGSITVAFSSVEGLVGGLGGSGNIGADPVFVRAPDDGGDGWGVGGNDDYGDVHLTAGSPCIDRGDPSVPPPGEGADIDGEMRVRDCRLDMGADETSFAATDCNGNGVPDACDLLDGTSPDCNRNLVPDECDIAAGRAPDCNANGVPDGCETIPPQIDLDSGMLSPIGNGFPQSYALPILADAESDVTLSFWAFADLNTTSEYVDVDVNGTFVARIYEAGTTSCAAPPAEADLIVDAGTFNGAVRDGSVVVTMTASTSVNGLECGGTSFIRVEVAYAAAAPNDLDEDGVIDVCECPADCAQPPDGVVGLDDLVAVLSTWGEIDGVCDVDFDGVVGFGDLLGVLEGWGPCPP